MAKNKNRCKHDWSYKPDYPEDIICMKCGTIRKVADLTRQQVLKLPMDVRQWILKNQAEQFISLRPDAYKLCPLCCEPTADGTPHKECMDYEQAVADGAVEFGK